eukprot:3372379-Rhodomonas_salina.3
MLLPGPRYRAVDDAVQRVRAAHLRRSSVPYRCAIAYAAATDPLVLTLRMPLHQSAASATSTWRSTTTQTKSFGWRSGMGAQASFRYPRSAKSNTDRTTYALQNQIRTGRRSWSKLCAKRGGFGWVLFCDVWYFCAYRCAVRGTAALTGVRFVVLTSFTLLPDDAVLLLEVFSAYWYLPTRFLCDVQY